MVEPIDSATPGILRRDEFSPGSVQPGEVPGRCLRRAGPGLADDLHQAGFGLGSRSGQKAAQEKRCPEIPAAVETRLSAGKSPVPGT